MPLVCFSISTNLFINLSVSYNQFFNLVSSIVLLIVDYGLYEVYNFVKLSVMRYSNFPADINNRVDEITTFD